MVTGRVLGDSDRKSVRRHRKRLRLVRDSNRKRRSRLLRDWVTIEQKEILTERCVGGGRCHDFIKVVVWLMMV